MASRAVAEVLVRGLKGKDYTITFLGCGNLNTAILSGILSSLSERNGNDGADGPTCDSLPNKFIACVRSESSANRIKSVLGSHADKVDVRVNDNIAAVEAADVVVLGCKPFVFRQLLSQPRLRDALRGKVLISILAGVTTEMLIDAVGRSHFIPVRVMPNTAAMVRQSMTVIEIDPGNPLPPTLESIITWIFSQVGKVAKLPPTAMDACTALCGSGPAFAAIAIEGLADGAVAMGVPRAEAQLMAAQTVRGSAELVLLGDHPALLREKVSTPGGCTIAGTLILEESGVRGKMARAVREATSVASQLGSGVVNVNGTRPSHGWGTTD